ncbi:MAG: hypothetical protein JHC98_05250 [Thermoleophilaceae bacterium]|nr:hypothetical protein [Thermoleophilaceae bacterium]
MTAAPSNNRGAELVGKLVGCLIAACVLFGAAASSAAAASSWSAYPLPRTSPFEQPLGQPTSLSCWSANACVLLTVDNPYFTNGVFAFTGDTTTQISGWKQYATVCGPGDGGSANARVAWAGPNEFWTLTTPSSPWNTGPNAGRGLCHFSAGQIVGSYSTIRGLVDTSNDPYQPMEAAACRSSNECWFGGAAAAMPDGTNPGTFHLRWDGSSLKSVYAPAKRGAADIEAFDGGFAESVYAGPDSKRESDPTLIDVPEYSPIQLIESGANSATGFTDGDLDPDVPGFAPEATEVLALDAGLPSDPGSILWAVGGGAASGPQKDQEIDGGMADDSPADTGPFIAVREAGVSNSWHQIGFPSDPEAINTRFVDVAAIPGTDQAIAAIAPGNSPQPSPAPSEIARLDASAGTVAVETIGNYGSVQRVECVNADQCWAATADGRLLRYADSASPVTANPDPAFAAQVLSRPNEVIEQALADSSTDDSLLFAPAPVTEAEEPRAPKRLKAAVRKVTTRLRGTRLIFGFKTIRKVRVTIQAKRRGRVVAQSRSGLLRPGRHTMVLRLNPKRWPTKIAMSVKEPSSATASTAVLPCAASAACGQ